MTSYTDREKINSENMIEIDYPEARRDDSVIDDYHGVKVRMYFQGEILIICKFLYSSLIILIRARSLTR